MNALSLPVLDPAATQELIRLACEWTGFSTEAIQPGAITGAVAERLRAGATLQDVLFGAREREPETVGCFFRHLVVGETFFFRQPEHFDIIAEHLKGMAASDREVLDAWSAGCATGEEAFSLAAALLGVPHPFREVRVLGTDLSDQHVDAARQGRFGTWSVRATTPLRFPLFEPDGGADRQRRVLAPLRRITRFHQHNLLDVPPEPGRFELIFCRNVLIYLAPEAARRVVENLTRALAPGGLLFFGPMDIQEVPAGLMRVGAAEQNVFRRVSEHSVQPVPSAGRKVAGSASRRREPVAPEARLSSAKPLPTKPSDARSSQSRPQAARPQVAPDASADAVNEPVTLHLRALVAAERGDGRDALRCFQDLTRRFPDYVPGLVDAALANVRDGRTDVACEQMQEVLRRTEHLDMNLAIAGPQSMKVEWYRRTAAAWLERSGRPLRRHPGTPPHP